MKVYTHRKIMASTLSFTGKCDYFSHNFIHNLLHKYQSN